MKRFSNRVACPRWLRPSIGTKLLLVILPCMLAGSVVMFLMFERFTYNQRVSELGARLDAFAITQATSLIKPMWTFDTETVERLFRSYADIPELFSAELRNTRGQVIATAHGRQFADFDETFSRETPLVRQTADGSHIVGQLTITFHDGLVRSEVARQRRAGVIVLSGTFLLLAAATLLAVSRLVVAPLARLRDSFHQNAASEKREPLAWSSNDELGAVTRAYNLLLQEIDQRALEIHHLAHHDTLTGLPNRRLLEDRLRHALAMAEREGRSLAVLFADIDNFKVVNDTLGHEVGDDLICLIAGRLIATVRSMDTVARWGGDEFVVIIENIASPAEVTSISEKIVTAIGQPVTLDNNLLCVGVSIGISLFPDDGHDSVTLIKNADIALFEAKRRGRNAFHFFDQTMNSRALRRLGVDVALRQALQSNQFELHYQPQVSGASGRMVGVEALIRWRSGDDLVPPDQFIPVAEESDLIVAIGDWVLREACAQITRWKASGLGDIHVAVNLSTRHFRRPEDVEKIIAAVGASGVSPHLIEIEMTESALMHDRDNVATQLKRLREHGFGIAIDDFGTGYSNLSDLPRLPVTTLKIDRSFIKDIEHNKDDAEIVRTIIAMAHTLKLGLVAEGVETEGQVTFLLNCACDVIQGYFFAHPMPAQDIETFVTKTASPETLGTMRHCDETASAVTPAPNTADKPTTPICCQDIHKKCG